MVAMRFAGLLAGLQYAAPHDAIAGGPLRGPCGRSKAICRWCSTFEAYDNKTAGQVGVAKVRQRGEAKIGRRRSSHRLLLLERPRRQPRTNSAARRLPRTQQHTGLFPGWHLELLAVSTPAPFPDQRHATAITNGSLTAVAGALLSDEP